MAATVSNRALMRVHVSPHRVAVAVPVTTDLRRMRPNGRLLTVDHIVLRLPSRSCRQSVRPRV